IMFMVGTMILALFYLPLILRHKLKESPNNEAILHVSGFVGLAFTTVGSLFKIMHWPGASLLLMIGMGTLAFLYVPIYFFKKYKTSANRPITLSSSLVAMTCLILVFALTRVNNSVGYGEGITQIDDQLRTTLKLTSNNQALYSGQYESSEALEIHAIADETVEYLDSVKATIISTVDQVSDEEAREKRLFFVKNATDYQTPTQILFESAEKDPSNIKEMVIRLERFENVVMQVYPSNIRNQVAASFPIDTHASFDVDGEQWDWGKYSFYKIPVIGVISNISKLQSEIRQAENQALVYLISRPEASNPPS
ncbi:MAG: GldL-related protein, partial [Flavobacteriales bacterium]